MGLGLELRNVAVCKAWLILTIIFSWVKSDTLYKVFDHKAHCVDVTSVTFYSDLYSAIVSSPGSVVNKCEEEVEVFCFVLFLISNFDTRQNVMADFVCVILDKRWF